MSTVSSLFITEKAILVLSKPADAHVDSTSTASATASALSGVTSTSTTTSDYQLTLQYNPSSISFIANAQSVPFQYLQQNLDQGIPNMNTRPPSVVMSVDLVFDDMNVTDAYSGEMFTVNSIGDVITTVAAIATTHSVQPQTNGLIAAVMGELTRTVTFRWADMSFRGELSEIRARYTMFSVSGKPVRSVVTMSITQQVSTDAENQEWNDAFDTAFGASSSSVSSSVTSTSVTSLFT